MACDGGNLGARPNPPHTGSKLRSPGHERRRIATSPPTGPGAAVLARSSVVKLLALLAQLRALRVPQLGDARRGA